MTEAALKLTPDMGKVNYALPTGEVVPALPSGVAFHNSNTRRRLLIGPFGSGKSSICCNEIFRRASKQKPQKDGVRRSRWLVVRNTYPQLKDTTIRTWLDWFPDVQYGRFVQTPLPEHRMRWEVQDKYGNVSIVECLVLFRALDKPEHVANLLSLEVTGAWINESRELSKAVFDAVDGRIGRYPAVKDGGCTWKGTFMDTNPPDTDHWIYKVFEEDRPPDHEVWHQSGKENEANLYEGYYDQIAVGKDPEWVRIYVKGQYGFIAEGKAVYPEFAREIHVADEPLQHIPGVPFVVGIDFGLTPAMVWTQLTPSGRWHIIHEEVADSLGIDRFGDRCIEVQNTLFPEKDNSYRYWADPAGNQRAQTDEKTCIQILANKGIDCDLGAVDFTSRREAVAGRLNMMSEGKPAMIISPTCKTVVKGFMGGYHYHEIGGTGRYTEKPEKNQYSHPHDALQYAASGIFSVTRGKTKRHKKRRPANWQVQ